MSKAKLNASDAPGWYHATDKMDNTRTVRYWDGAKLWQYQSNETGLGVSPCAFDYSCFDGPLSIFPADEKIRKQLDAATHFIAWGLTHEQVAHANLRRWVDEVSKVANEAFKLNGCCHWEGVCEGIEKMAAAAVEASKPEATDFKECATCAAKPGSPYLCDSCLQNRTVIGRLTADLAAQKQGNLFFLHAPEEWLGQAQELVTWIQNNVHSLKTSGWHEFHKRTNALAMFIRECTLATEAPTVYLDAPEACIAEAKEAIARLRENVGGSFELKELDALARFFGYCVPLAPDLQEQTSIARSAQAEVERLREHIQGMDKTIDALKAAPCPECAKLVEFFRGEGSYYGRAGDAANISAADCALSVIRTNEAKLKAEVPLVAATERRANALAACRRIGKELDDHNCPAPSDVRIVREFIESTVPADEVKAIIEATGPCELLPGVWVTEGRGTILSRSCDHPSSLAAGCRAKRVADVPEFEPAKKPFELPPPGTLFKVRFNPAGNAPNDRTFYRFPGGAIIESDGDVWNAGQFDDNCELIEVSASFRMGPVKPTQ